MPRERQDAPDVAPPTTADVRAFWENNPVTAAAISSQPGTIEFFAAFERLRQMVEPTDVQEEVYAFGQFAGKAVLDVGCGNGYLLSQYARRGARACGTDLTWTAIDLSRKRFALEAWVVASFRAMRNGCHFVMKALISLSRPGFSTTFPVQRPR